MKSPSNDAANLAASLADPYRSPPPVLCAPPRHVPLGVRLRLMFGGFIPMFGFFFYLVGFVISLGIAPSIELPSSDGPHDTVPAEVTSVYSSNVKVNNERVWAVEFGFRVDGRYHTGKSFSTTQAAVGQHYDAEVPRGQPERAVLAGMTRKPMPLWCAFVLLFPLVGIAFVLVAVTRGRRAARLLAEGEVARGKLVGKRATNVSVNNRTVFELRFEFIATNGEKYEAVARTHQPALLEDEPTEQLVYLAAAPEQATLIDHLPGAPRVQPDGTIAAPHPARVAVPLLMPLAAAAVTVGGIVIALG
jgi:hypothetical protein